MRRALLALCALPLSGAGIAMAAPPLPGRAQVERAVNAWFACRAGQDCTGMPAFRRQLSRSRCQRLPRDESHPGRILCVFSGVNLRADQPPTRFRNDCVYLIPARRGWTVSSIPDADMCE